MWVCISSKTEELAGLMPPTGGLSVSLWGHLDAQLCAHYFPLVELQFDRWNGAAGSMCIRAEILFTPSSGRQWELAATGAAVWGELAVPVWESRDVRCPPAKLWFECIYFSSQKKVLRHEGGHTFTITVNIVWLSRACQNPRFIHFCQCLSATF